MTHKSQSVCVDGEYVEVTQAGEGWEVRSRSGELVGLAKAQAGDVRLKGVPVNRVAALVRSTRR